MATGILQPDARVAIYARVSTTGNGQSPEMQLRELRDYCERRDWRIVGEYVDSGVSGAKDSRPELNRLSPLVQTLARSADSSMPPFAAFTA